MNLYQNKHNTNVNFFYRNTRYKKVYWQKRFLVNIAAYFFYEMNIDEYSLSETFKEYKNINK